MNEVVKTCSKCGESKPLGEFHKDSNAKDGRCYHCKVCARSRTRQWGADNKERKKAADKDYRQKNKPRHNEHNRRSYHRNLERSRERGRINSKRYQQRHPDRVRQQNQNYYKKNRDSELARGKQWRAAHKDVVQFLNRLSRAKTIGASGTCTLEQLEARFALWGNCCAYCGDPADSVDHVQPISRGGSNWAANLRPCCRPCNSKKRDKSWDTWLKRGIK